MGQKVIPLTRLIYKKNVSALQTLIFGWGGGAYFYISSICEAPDISLWIVHLKKAREWIG